ncbi:hypothetical protein EIL87_13240 [Saccharopolyspora rhizosphaerae]|uniref:Uncharacterized protein n=1 Tax=Saccharopolyspora rhizosphaerae TaxID=2492662 RepID=A0A3R8QN47_9PSEU|nr:hypothetical protein [Saccharopolyspora rhizosphaerae]RRO16038.1 hypothetical protein EIL87_13240 [Saccharopolyspora rhizosphaerae]
MTRRHGLFGPNTVRIIALVLALGLASSIGAPYLIQAGVPLPAVIVLCLVVLAVPVLAILRSEKSKR